MKKLIKPSMAVDQFSDETVQAFCEYDGCKKNCNNYCEKITVPAGGGWITGTSCTDIKNVEIADDILF